MTIRRSRPKFQSIFRMRCAFRHGVGGAFAALALAAIASGAGPAPAEVSGGPIGNRSQIGEPERSQGPDLDLERWSVPTPKPRPDQQPNPNPNPVPPKPSPGPHPAPPNWWWVDYPSLGVGYSSAYYYYPPLVGAYSPIDPNLMIQPPQDLAAEPPAPPTAAELLFSGNYDEAATILREDLAVSPDDPERTRFLALTLAAQRDFESAASLMEEVYLTDPDISVYPLDGEALFESPLELRRVVVGAVRHAQRTGTARAWLLVAVLMQAEGRDEVAFKMLGRAAAQGLDERITLVWPDPAA